MFEIPDDDENFWNDDQFFNKLDGSVNKDNKPQFQVPDIACVENPAKRLCSGYNRDSESTIQSGVTNFPQLRSIHKVPDNTLRGNNQSAPGEVKDPNTYPEAPFHIPFPSTSVDRHGSAESDGSGTVIKIAGDKTDTPSLSHRFKSSTDISNSLQSNSLQSSSLRTQNVELNQSNGQTPSENVYELKSKEETLKQSNVSSLEIGQNYCATRGQMSPADDRVMSNIGNSVGSNHGNVSLGNQCDNLANSVLGNQGDRRRSRSGDDEAEDYVTPKRKRKFPGPAGILPKLGPGKSLDMLSPANLNITAPISRKSPQEDSLIVCSQASEDVFTDTPWQAMISDLGEDGHRLLKKFSIASTLFKAGKKQLDQGKAAVVFGIIDTLESHGSEASVTLRDKSGRMQGTIHHDLLKEHEAELQMGTVLVLKQVSIISLSNRNHYLNITPNNVVALYRSGEGSIKSQKFHGSQDSLQSVLSALEKKANQRSANSSVTMTPSSHQGSLRQSLVSPGPSTPQLFTASPLTPSLNQSLFPSASSPAQIPSPAQRTPLFGGIRDVSVVQRNPAASLPGQNNSRFSFKPKIGQPNSSLINRPSTSGLNASADFNRTGSRSTALSPVTPNPSTRPPFATSSVNPVALRDTRTGLNTPSINPSLTPSPRIISTQNTDFKIVPIKNNSTENSLNNQSTISDRGGVIRLNGSSSLAPEQAEVRTQNAGLEDNSIQNCDALTASVSGKSRWKFKSPPSSKVASASSSPDINALANASSSPDLNVLAESKVNKLKHTASDNNHNSFGKSSDILNAAGVPVSVSITKESSSSINKFVAANGVNSTQFLVDKSYIDERSMRNCQLKMPANSLNQGDGNNNKSVGRGGSSAWSFKSKETSDLMPSTSSIAIGVINGTEMPSKEDNLWDDDLSDDLLSQLSQDLS